MRGNISGGMSYFVRGVKLLQHPRLRPFVIIPLAINIVIFATLIYYSVGLVDATMASWMSAIPDWLSWLKNNTKLLPNYF